MNSGVLVLDLDRWWAEQQIGTAVLDDLRAHQHLYRFHDQCGLNAVLHNHWATLPPEWNIQCGAGEMRAAPAPLSDIAILHFTSARKPWKPDYAEPPGHSRMVELYRRLWLRRPA